MRTVCKLLLLIVICFLTLRLFINHRVRYNVSYIRPTPISIRSYLAWPDEGPDVNKLQNLETIPWPNYIRPAPLSHQQVFHLQPFYVRLSPGQYTTLELLLSMFEQTMISLEWQDQWYIGGETLLGSLQHHDIVPWHDGIDLFTHVHKRQMLQNQLKLLAPNFVLRTQSNVDLLYMQPLDDTNKIGAETAGSIVISQTPWPYITLHYYEDISPGMGRELGNPKNRLNLSDVFPVTYRPLGKHWYPAPRRPITFLKSTSAKRKDSACFSLSFSRALEKNLEVISKECRELMRQFCFVYRCPVSRKEVKENATLFRDEYLVNGNGRSVHKIRTALDPDQVDLPFHVTPPDSFTCP
ncbi:hypothetical protein Aperf_G00000075931 [Anoplocephala perfoliata]